MTDVLDFLAEQVANNEIAWSLGTFGAIAEFMRDADEPVVFDRADGSISAVTARGALRIALHPEFRPIASESLTTESWALRVKSRRRSNSVVCGVKHTSTEPRLQNRNYEYTP